MPIIAVEEALSTAKAIAFDGCHKIYVLMDDEAVKEQRMYGYGDGSDDSKLLMVSNPAVALKTIEVWLEASCFLKFVNSVRTVKGNPNDGYVALIEQGEYDEDTESEDDDLFGYEGSDTFGAEPGEFEDE